MINLLRERKKFFLACLFLISISFSEGINAMGWEKMTLNITNIDTKREGDVVVMVFSEDGFPKEHEKALKTYRLDSTQEKQVITVEVPESEEFAIKVHHDENSDGKVTKNWTGFIPSEGLGFSSDAKARFGPPGFKQATINPSKTNVHLIRMSYP